MAIVRRIDKHRNVLMRILESPHNVRNRTGEDHYTRALLFAAKILPENQEKSALMYLARNPGADIILDNGDKVITSGIKKAIEIMEKK